MANKVTKPGEAQGRLCQRKLHDEWKRTAENTWYCAPCRRERAARSSLTSYHKRRACELNDPEWRALLTDEPGDQEILLPTRPLRRLLDRHAFVNFTDDRPAGVRDILSDTQYRALRRAEEAGGITVKQADSLLDILEVHGRELWGDDYDLAVWGGKLPADFWPSTEIRRMGQVEQARASFERVSPLATDQDWMRKTVDRLRHVNRRPRA
jgi:hypothetical protein